MKIRLLPRKISPEVVVARPPVYRIFKVTRHFSGVPALVRGSIIPNGIVGPVKRAMPVFAVFPVTCITPSTPNGGYLTAPEALPAEVSPANITTVAVLSLAGFHPVT
jgi:hypothetical protein